MLEQAAALATPAPVEPAQDPEGGVSPSMATATPAAVEGPIIWDTVAPIFNVRCSACHASNGMKGVDLSSYQKALEGGTDGPVIVAGDPDNSLLIKTQTDAKKHFGQFSASELETVRQWILAGAKEK
jgi:mono/diheme cytochrome c family protein